MALSFRCENCGKLLSFQSNPGAKVKCPGCKETVAVPEALASLPEPKTGPEGARAQPRPDAPNQADAQGPPEEQEEEFVEEEYLGAGMMSSIMSVLMSVLFHVALAVIIFFALGMQKGKPEEKEKVNRVVNYNPDEFNEDPSAALEETAKSSMMLDENQAKITKSEEVNRIAPDIEVPQLYTGGSISDDLDPAAGAGGDLGPRAGLFDAGGNAHNIVYVIDASGSMINSIDRVRMEMLRRIGELHEVQTFHVVFFNDKLKDELPSQRLLPATKANRAKAADFLMGVRAESRSGQTDPTGALQRAFDVLRRADPNKPGNMIFLLTDGEFTGTTREELLAALKQMGRGVDAQIYTFLYGPSGGNPNNPNSIQSVLKAISGLTKHGTFTHVTED
jgi:hypothetical protein